MLMIRFANSLQSMQTFRKRHNFLLDHRYQLGETTEKSNRTIHKEPVEETNQYFILIKQKYFTYHISSFDDSIGIRNLLN